MRGFFSEEMKHHWKTLLGIATGFFLAAIASAIFLNRDVVYEVNLENSSNNKVQVSGLAKEYKMKIGENGEIFEVQNWTMKQDEIEIKVKAPPDFEKYSKLVVEAELENPDSPTLEVGIKKQVDYLLGEPLFDWEWHFLDNKYLNEFKTYLGQEWSVISDQNLGLSLFQKEQKYNSVGNFLENPPQGKIGRWDAPAPKKYSFENNQITSGSTNFPFSFRGDFELAVFIDKPSDLKFQFEKIDSRKESCFLRNSARRRHFRDLQ